MTLKEYFVDSSLSSMKKMEQVRMQSKRNLTDRIDDLSGNEVGIIAVRLIPNEFMRHANTEEEGANNWQKNGIYYPLNQPLTETEAFDFRQIPLTSRAQAVTELRGQTNHLENLQVLGFSWKGISSEDRKERKLPFVKVGKAHRTLSYAKHINETLIEHIYTNRRMEESGATVICSIPSRRKGVSDYTVKLDGVPFFNGADKRVLAWNLGTSFVGNSPMDSLGKIKLDKSRPIYVSSQELAAYMAFTEHQFERYNFTPLEVNPFPIFSEEQARFALKLNNQVLVQDISHGGKLRKPYEAEQSWLLMQRALKKGHDKTLYWNPSRDGQISNYRLDKAALSLR